MRKTTSPPKPRTSTFVAPDDEPEGIAEAEAEAEEPLVPLALVTTAAAVGRSVNVAEPVTDVIALGVEVDPELLL